MTNFERGFIVAFNCCLEGRGLTKQDDGTYVNLDGVNIGKKSWHPFLIISNTIKNNSSFTRYLHAIPISSSNSKFNQETGLLITQDMLSSGGNQLLSNHSLLKTDSIISLHKNGYNDYYLIMGQINPSSTPYKKILSEVAKNFGCYEILK